MLALYKSAKLSNTSWPIICIDEANILTECQAASLENKGAIKALLRFFVKVSMNCAERTTVQAWRLPLASIQF